MDKTVKKYEKALLTLLEDYARIKPVNWKSAQNQVIADRQNHHYQLVRFGWQDNHHVHYAVFHFDIINGKVWIQQNRTDMPIVDELEELGIPEKDIVVANFYPVGLPQNASVG
ncbi:MAG: XisI protein [Bacteroidota bacterium]